MRLLLLALLFGMLASPAIADPAAEEPASWDGLTRQAVGETITWVREAKGFAQEQAPLVVAELIRRDTVRAAFGVLVAATLILIAADQFRRGWRNGTKEEDFESFGSGGRIAISIGVLVICGIVCLYNTDWLLRVVLAPRLYVLEQLAGLMK